MQTEIFAGSQGTVQQTYAYGKQGDGTDQMLSVNDPTGIIDQKYGHRGRTDETTYEGLGRKLARRFDSAGNLIGMDLKDAAGLILKTSSYVPDERNRVSQYVDWAGNNFAYKYNAADQITKVEITPNGASSIMVTATYSYDGAGRLLSILYRKHKTGPILAKAVYDYDEAGNRTTRHFRGSDSNYAYNALNELNQDSNTGDTRGPLSFSYDGAGNRLSQTWNAGTQSYGLPGALNHLDSTSQGPNGTLSFGYDAEGNRSSKNVMAADGVVEANGSTTYQWEGKNRLTQVTLADATTIQYAYDYQNRMVSRTKGSEVRTYLYGSGSQVVEETLNGQRLALNGWGGDGLVSRTDALGHTLFYLKDGLGSVMAIVDEKANIVQSYEYSASGEELSGGDAVNSFRFAGAYGVQYDNDTHLHYMWNRWYDSSTGRFISEDPIRLDSGETNYYRYAENNPALIIDPQGLTTKQEEYATYLKCDGSRAWRNNNPGNMVYTSDLGSIFAAVHSDMYPADAKFGYNDSVAGGEAKGYEAMLWVLKAHYADLYPITAARKWASLNGGLNIGSTIDYTKSLLRAGVNPFKEVGDQINEMAYAIKSQEGWSVGTVIQK